MTLEEFMKYSESETNKINYKPTEPTTWEPKKEEIKAIVQSKVKRKYDVTFIDKTNDCEEEYEIEANFFQVNGEFISFILEERVVGLFKSDIIVHIVEQEK